MLILYVPFQTYCNLCGFKHNKKLLGGRKYKFGLAYLKILENDFCEEIYIIIHIYFLKLISKKIYINYKTIYKIQPTNFV